MINHRAEITCEYLRECFELNNVSGELRWKVRPVSHFANEPTAAAINSRYAGAIAGSHSRKAAGGSTRMHVSINRQDLSVHRVVFAMFHGLDYDKLPQNVDHIDCNPLNNSPSNLRGATVSENNCNRRLGLRNTTGAKGVKYNAEHNNWSARIKKNSVQAHLGTFETKQEAIAAYRGAAIILHGEFSRFE